MPITKRKLKNGKTVYDVREDMGFTVDGKRDRPKRTFATLREAKAEQIRMLAVRDARRNRSGKILFRDYVNNWWRPSTKGLAPNTHKSYDRDLRVHIMPVIENVDIRDINRAHVQRIVNGCSTHRRAAKNAVATLRTILNQAIADNIIVVNPANGKLSFPPRKHKRSETVLTDFAQIKRFLAYVEEYNALGLDKGDTCLKMAVTGLLMGLRPEERYGLDWSDFSWKTQTVRIQRAYARGENEPNALRETKTGDKGSNRTVPMPVAAYMILKRLYRDGATVRVGAFANGATQPRISPATAYSRWRKFLKWGRSEGRELPQVSLENCRHSFATSYLHAGGNVEDLSKILGHSNINTTFRRYVRPSDDDLKKAVLAIVNL